MIRSGFNRLELLVAILALAAPLSFRILGQEQPGYRLLHWTAENGLPQNSVRAFAQTADGYLWIGTLAGLARFDGVKFTIFNHGNTPEMSNDAINDLAVDEKDGTLWIATGNGILRICNRHVERVGAKSGTVGFLWSGRDGGVWFPDRNGVVALLRNGIIRKWQLAPETEFSAVKQVLDRGDETVWVLCQGSVYNLQPATGNITRLKVPTDVDGRGACFSFYEDHDRSAWLCGANGIWQHSREGWALVSRIDPLKTPRPEAILQGRTGELWVRLGTTAGRPVLRLLVNGEFEIPAASNLNGELNADRLYEDREGNLWIGNSVGLFQLRPKFLRVYSTHDGFANDDVSTIASGPDGTILLGTDHGVTSIRDGQASTLPVYSGAQFARAMVYLADRQGRTWTGWWGEKLVVLDSGEWRELPQWASAVFQDRNDNLWFSRNQGVTCVNPAGQEIAEYSRTTLGNCKIPLIYQDRRGDLWFGTFGAGLYHLRQQALTCYKTAAGEYNNRAWWIHEDADGIFWVGSQNGLNRFVPPGVIDPMEAKRLRSDRSVTANGQSRFFTFSTEHGLHDTVVNNIQEDNTGSLWLSGLHGIYRVSRADLNEVAAGLRGVVRVLALGEADGMLNSECNGGDVQPGGCTDEKGRIWFATARGAVMIDPGRIQTNTVAPAVTIEQLTAGDEIVYGDGCPREVHEVGPHERSTSCLQLAAGKGHVLQFRYTANSFVAPERIRFRYKLDGYDNKWRDADSTERTVFYTNLRPGSYKFHVNACNNHGVWNDEGASLAFAIAPTLVQRSWFPILCLALLLAITGGMALWRLRWERRILLAEQRANLERERSRIARDLHDDLGTALTGLALELDVVRKQFQASSDAPGRIESTARKTRQLAERMREVVWAVNPRCDTVPSLASFLEQQTAQFLSSDGIRGRLDFPDNIPDLPMESDTRHQLALAVREALTNVVRHAGASEVTVGLEIEPGFLVVRVSDNGRGMEPPRIARQLSGQGVTNMRERMAQISGSCDISSGGNGTTVKFRVPLRHSTMAKML